MKLKNILLYTLAIISLFVIVIFIINGRISSKSSVDDAYQIKIIIKDHKFYPDIIEAPSGRVIYLNITNKDDVPEEFESLELNRERIIMPNESINIILAPLPIGRYEFFGEFHPDTAKGSLIIY